MKRYLVFGGECYYARGGWRRPLPGNDFLDSFDDLDDADSFIKEWQQQGHFNEWAHVIDSKHWEIVGRTDETPYGDPERY